MGDVAIRVENLSKQYRIGGPQARYKTLRDSLSDAAAAPFRRISSVLRGESTNHRHETIWALKDVSFEVKKGEVVGIIGRNGAGKSTLLKVLSRITEPTEGTVDLFGRVGSLLEVGTGFHPELTGRENIYLNGAILGMKKVEIERKFDEIVDFSGVEKFIDTPVKHYSSGMYVRLAFAVAAHMDPEILLVDEVLAVGDAEFQKKCLGKMGEVAEEGRTVLFVSHSLDAIRNLCPICVVMDEGMVALNTGTNESIEYYLYSIVKKSTQVHNAQRKLTESDAMITRVSVVSGNQNGAHAICMFEDLAVRINLRAFRDFRYLMVGVNFFLMDGTRVFNHQSADQNVTISGIPGIYEIECAMNPNILSPGKYYISVGLSDTYSGYTYDYQDAICNVEILPIPKEGIDVRTNRPFGTVFLNCNWSIPKLVARNESNI